MFTIITFTVWCSCWFGFVPDWYWYFTRALFTDSDADWEQDIAAQLAHAFVLLRLDFINSCPSKSTITLLQKAQDAFAHLIMNLGWHTHVTFALSHVYWLSVHMYSVSASVSVKIVQFRIFKLVTQEGLL